MADDKTVENGKSVENENTNGVITITPDEAKAFSEGKFKADDTAFNDAMAAGLVKIAKPEEGATQKTDGEKGTPPVEEFVEAKIPKSTLGNYKSVEEKLKGVDMKDKRIRELNDALKTTELSLKEFAEKFNASKTEMDELKKQFAAKPTETKKEDTPAIDIDKIDMFDTEQLRAALKVALTKPQVSPEIQAEIKAIREKLDSNEKLEKENQAAMEAEAKIQADLIEVDEFQKTVKEPVLKLTKAFQDVDSEIGDFMDELARSNGVDPNDREKRKDIVLKYFEDNTSVGDAIRAKAVEKGLESPADWENYWRIMGLRSFREENALTYKGKPMPLDMVLTNYKHINGEFVKEKEQLEKETAEKTSRARAEGAKDVVKALENRDSNAVVISSSYTGGLTPDKITDKQGEDIMKMDLKDVAKNDNLWNLVSGFYKQLGVPLLERNEYLK